MLEVDVAAPSEENQRDVEGQRGTGDFDVAVELRPGDAQMLEKGAAVPQQQHHSGDQDRKDERLTTRVQKARALGLRFALRVGRR